MRLNICREKRTSASFDPYRNLAIEKYLTYHVNEEECTLFLWQNRRCVVIGKNQNAWKECNISKLTEDGGFLVRRLSGGGAVYHDTGNLNYSFCTRKTDYDTGKQTEVITRAVRRLGIPAQISGRNDILAEGRKFSGTAYYNSGDFCCHHGTIMVNVNRDEMSRYLNVDKEKLKGKGVASVRSRVVNLTEFNRDITVPLLEQSLIEAFADVYGITPGKTLDSAFFSEDALSEINNDAAWLSGNEWLYERPIPFTHRLEGRTASGGVELLLHVNRGKIVDCQCFTDAMDPCVSAVIVSLLKGTEYNKDAVARAVSRLPGMISDNSIVEHIRELLEG
ncbi:MAG: lipoate--protein ligase [Blautia sp.]|nr:lipoate--protein ligase [Blautia sp.]